MNRYIDADALIDELEELFAMRDDMSKGGLSEAMEVVHNMPTVDAVPVVHGRWIEYRYLAFSKCSECGSVYELQTNFCPKCGAKMDGKER